MYDIKEICTAHDAIEILIAELESIGIESDAIQVALSFCMIDYSERQGLTKVPDIKH